MSCKNNIISKMDLNGLSQFLRLLLCRVQVRNLNKKFHNLLKNNNKNEDLINFKEKNDDILLIF